MRGRYRRHVWWEVGTRDMCGERQAPQSWACARQQLSIRYQENKYIKRNRSLFAWSENRNEVNIQKENFSLKWARHGWLATSTTALPPRTLHGGSFKKARVGCCRTSARVNLGRQRLHNSLLSSAFPSSYEFKRRVSNALRIKFFFFFNLFHRRASSETCLLHIEAVTYPVHLK